MALHVRSGRPQHINATTLAATVQKWPVTVGPTKRVLFHNRSAAETIVLTLTTEAEASAGIGIGVPPGFGLDLDLEVIEFWTRSINPAAFEVLVTGRP